MEINLFNILPCLSSSEEFTMPASRWKYAVSLDTETTGSCRRSRVVQIAALRFRWRWNEEGKQEIEFSERFKFISLVKPPSGTPFHPRAVEITGLGPRELRLAPCFEEILEDMDRVLANLPLIAHNVPFDRRMLGKEREIVGAEAIALDRWQCSMSKTRRMHPGESYRLVEVAKRLDVHPTGKLHDAGTDAELAARVWANFDLAEQENACNIFIKKP